MRLDLQLGPLAENGLLVDLDVVVEVGHAVKGLDLDAEAAGGHADLPAALGTEVDVELILALRVLLPVEPS